MACLHCWITIGEQTDNFQFVCSNALYKTEHGGNTMQIKEIEVKQVDEYTAQEGMPYLRGNDQHRSLFGEPPVVVNYFYHEEVKKSAKKIKE